jgi:hypothetical protein
MTTAVSRADALALVAEGAAARDREPVARFPVEAIGALQDAGMLAGDLPFSEQLGVVRDVARADASVARIVDGHLNAVERLAVHARPPLRDTELRAVADGRLLLGVWGADPRASEGEPARIRDGALYGTKTFCSGAGGLQRAIVLAGDLLAYVDLGSGVTVDADWFAGSGMRASVSHRVVFDGAPVLAQLGPPGAITQQPWFARDAVRTAATWAGAADAAADEALRLLAATPVHSELVCLAAGRIRTEQRTIALLLADGGARGDADTLGAADSAYLRHAIATAAARLLDEAARACGSHPFATGGALDRIRRDVGLFVLQHRLDPIVARAGAAALEEAR